MPYNQYNNDLPVPPRGHANWRSVYGSMLTFMKSYEGGAPPTDAIARFLHNGKEARIGTDELPILEVPYWKIAHYAAREQAEDDAKIPPIAFHELRLVMADVQAGRRNALEPNSAILAWLEYHVEKAWANERSRDSR